MQSIALGEKGRPIRGPSTSIIPKRPNILSGSMLSTQEESSLEVVLADMETMKSAAAKVLCRTASQHAQQYLLKPASKTSLGRKTSLTLRFCCTSPQITIFLLDIFGRSALPKHLTTSGSVRLFGGQTEGSDYFNGPDRVLSSASHHFGSDYAFLWAS